MIPANVVLLHALVLRLPDGNRVTTLEALRAALEAVSRLDHIAKQLGEFLIEIDGDIDESALIRLRGISKVLLEKTEEATNVGLNATEALAGERLYRNGSGDVDPFQKAYKKFGY